MIASGNSESLPLVSIGIPVRNGAEGLENALKDILSQSYANIEIIISNNASTDGTDLICKAYADRDNRIQYFSQDHPITAMENFKFVLLKGKGEYFFWAAHDDRRTENWIEVLIDKLIDNKEAVLAFSDYAEFNSSRPIGGKVNEQYPTFSGRKSNSIFEIFRGRVHVIHTYALMRAEAIRAYPFDEIDYFGDVALVTYMAVLGDFLYVKGACFFYYCPILPKTAHEHAMSTSYKQLKRFPRTRIALYTCNMIVEARLRMRVAPRRFFALCQLLWIFYKEPIYSITPGLIKTGWKKWLGLSRRKRLGNTP